MSNIRNKNIHLYVKNNKLEHYNIKLMTFNENHMFKKRMKTNFEEFMFDSKKRMDHIKRFNIKSYDIICGSFGFTSESSILNHFKSNGFHTLEDVGKNSIFDESQNYMFCNDIKYTIKTLHYNRSYFLPLVCYF